MRFNRSKFNAFARNVHVQALETDERIYRLYLKTQQFADVFWPFLLRSLKAVARQFIRHPKAIIVIVLSVISEHLVAGIAGGKFDLAPAAVWTAINVLAIAMIFVDSMLPRSTRDTGVECAPRN